VAFQIKDFVSICASMINHMRGTQTKITDFQPGSAVRTIVEAPAVEIEELYLQMFIGLREAIPVATFQSFGFDKYPSTYATGFVSISCKTAITESFIIPAGTVFSAEDGRTYRSVADVAWNVGTAIVSVPVAATAAGAAGNIEAGYIIESNSSLFDDNFTISNQTISNGTDEESDEAREARFAEYVSSLSRGTKHACMYAAKQASVRDAAGNILERVARIGFTEIAGYFKIFLYSNFGVPSDELIANGQMLLDGMEDPDTKEILVIGFRSAAIRGDILPMREREVSMSIGVRMRTGYALTNETKQSVLDTYSLAIRNIQPGDSLLIDNLRAQLLGVRNVLEVSLSSSQNITCEQSEALVPGNVPIFAL